MHRESIKLIEESRESLTVWYFRNIRRYRTGNQSQVKFALPAQLRLISDLDKSLHLVGLQTLSLRQQPHVEVRLVVASRSACLLPLHAPCCGVEASKEVSILLHTSDVVLVEHWRIAVDQVQQTGVVGVGRESERYPDDICRGAGAGQRRVSPRVEARRLTLQKDFGELVVGYDFHLQTSINLKRLA